MTQRLHLILAAAVLWASSLHAQQAPAEIRAQITPRDFTTLAAEIAARIDNMPLREGDRFAKGAVLVVFDCSLAQAQLEEAHAELHAAELTLEADQRLLSLKTIGKLESGLAAANTDKMRARLSSAQAVVNRCVIRAPYGGHVAEQKARNQQFVQPGQALLDLLDDTRPELEFVVSSHWLTWLKGGYAFKVAIDETKTRYPAVVRRISPRIDPVSQSVKIIGEISGTHPELLAGMSGRVEIAAPPP